MCSLWCVTPITLWCNFADNTDRTFMCSEIYVFNVVTCHQPSALSSRSNVGGSTDRGW